MRSAFTIEAASTGKQTLLMTAAVAAGKSSIDAGYEIAAVCEYLYIEFKILMIQITIAYRPNANIILTATNMA